MLSLRGEKRGSEPGPQRSGAQKAEGTNAFTVGPATAMFREHRCHHELVPSTTPQSPSWWPLQAPTECPQLDPGT